MHLVFVTSLVPVENPSSGFDIANRAVYEGLVALGHRVSVVGFAGPADKPLKSGDVHLLGRLESRTPVSMPGARQAGVWRLRGQSAVSVAKMRAVDEADLRAELDGLGPIDGFVLNSVQCRALSSACSGPCRRSTSPTISRPPPRGKCRAGSGPPIPIPLLARKPSSGGHRGGADPAGLLCLHLQRRRPAGLWPVRRGEIRRSAAGDALGGARRSAGRSGQRHP